LKIEARTKMNAASVNSAPMKYPPTYYLNSRMLPSHINRTVRLFGRVVQVSADATRVQIEACDGGIVTVIRTMVFPSKMNVLYLLIL
jgi:hypothetical protein